MKLFALKDAADRDGEILAVLSCYSAYGGREREYYIDLPQGADPWNVPLILSSFAKRGRWTVGPEWSRRWVESRVVPPSRQNIGEVLRENALDSYDELALLEATEGRNSQDSCFLEPLLPAALPAWFAEREGCRVIEAVALPGRRLLVAFKTGEVRVYCDDDLISAEEGVKRVFTRSETFACVQVACGGRGVQWGSAVRVPDEALRRTGALVPLSWSDLSCIVAETVVDAAETAEMLGCTRQNVHALMRRGSLPAVKAGGKSTLFLRADVRAREGV